MTNPGNNKFGRPRVAKNICANCKKEKTWQQWQNSACYRGTCRKKKNRDPELTAKPT